MNASVNIFILALLILIYVTFTVLMSTLRNKFLSLKQKFVKENKRLSYVLSLLNYDVDVDDSFFHELGYVYQNFVVDSISENVNIEKLEKVAKREAKNLKHRKSIRRKSAAVYLGLIGSDYTRTMLEERLVIEEDYSVKLYISNALTDINNPKSIPIMLDALKGSHQWYRQKAIAHILLFGYQCQSVAFDKINSLDYEMQEFTIKYASKEYNTETLSYLLNFVDHYDQRVEKTLEHYEHSPKDGLKDYNLSYLEDDMKALLGIACRTLSNYYYDHFSKEEYYMSDNPIILQNAYWALANSKKQEHLLILLSLLKTSSYPDKLIGAISKMLEISSSLTQYVDQHFFEAQDMEYRKKLARVLSSRIEYYLLQLNTKSDKKAESIIIAIINAGIINEFIGFININKNKAIEYRLVEMLKEYVDADGRVGTELRTYLKHDFLVKWEVDAVKKESKEEKKSKDKHLSKFVVYNTILAFLIPPFIFLSYNYRYLIDHSFSYLIKRFIIHGNYYLAFYSITVTCVFVVLLAMSLINVKKQSHLWGIKNISMLFKENILPTITVIAPAFNEETTIVESARSLLNLHYPDYEVVIVNDGSGDETLLNLIQAFGLVRVNYHFESRLETEPILGIYRNPSIPRLIVVDKSNGGKADALNAGINISNKTYFCGIDADSLLESDALIKIASLIIDEVQEVPALGGNILPINGCEVDHGMITQIAVPKNMLAKLQFTEYLRAFMAGRLGWQQMDSLLIVSGEFGLFRKDRIVNIGGYLTEKSVYNKSTVGEDMELIVRISEMLKDKKHNHKILYAFNANCWTQVPEDLKSLKSQRYRWQRGLVDILHYHRKMIFNPHYGRSGFVAMTYYYLFEFIGPIIETEGYIMFVLAIVLGIFNQQIALLLFISVVLMGINLSLLALLIAEKESHYFTFKDMVKLMVVIVIENFGFRQMISVWRFLGQISTIFVESGWGKVRRKEM